MSAADRYCQTTLGRATANGDNLLVAQALHGLAFSAIMGGEYGEGRRLAQRSLLAADVERIDLRAYALDLGQRLQITQYLGDLAMVALECGDHTRAEALGREGLALARALDSAIYVAHHLCVLGQVETERRAFESARQCLSEALRCVLEHRLWTTVARVAFQVALLLAHEAAAAEAGAK